MKQNNVINLRDRKPHKWDENFTPTICAYGPSGIKERKRLLDMFKGYNKMAMRYFWDNCGDDSFYHGPEGHFDCSDIHSYMNMTGDGIYCAV